VGYSGVTTDSGIILLLTDEGPGRTYRTQAEKHLIFGLDRTLFSGNFSAAVNVSKVEDMVMKAYLANVPTAIWALIALPGLVLTRCVVAAVVPQVVHAVVPEVVRNVLRVI